MTKLLISAKDLAITSLTRLTETECLSIPQVKPNGVQLPSQLTETLSDTEAILRELLRHLQELAGDNPLSYGPLGNEMGYSVETEDLADPKDLEDDQETVEEWIQKVRSKLKTIYAQPSSLKPNPVQDTTWESISSLKPATR